MGLGLGLGSGLGLGLGSGLGLGLGLGLGSPEDELLSGHPVLLLLREIGTALIFPLDGLVKGRVRLGLVGWLG